jgi:uncharacterized protein YgiM (DUF1202 family)
VNAEIIQIGPTHTEPVWMVVCNSGGLNLRTGAGTDEQVIKILQDGQEVALTGRIDTPVFTDWYEIRVGAFLTGWVSSRYLCAK